MSGLDDDITALGLEDGATDPLTEAGEQVTKWTRKRDNLILAARTEGESLRQIADRAGISHTQVVNITRRDSGAET